MKSTSCSSQSAIIRSSSGVPSALPVPFGDVEPRQVELLGQAAAGVAVADHERGLGLHLAVANRPQQRERRLGPIGDANRQPRPPAGDLRRPGANRELRPLRHVGHRLAQLVEARGVEVDPREHREDALLVVVVHLDFGDVRAHAGHGMDDRIGQSAIIGADGGDDDLHGRRMQEVGVQGSRSDLSRPHTLSLHLAV